MRSLACNQQDLGWMQPSHRLWPDHVRILIEGTRRQSRCLSQWTNHNRKDSQDCSTNLVSDLYCEEIVRVVMNLPVIGPTTVRVSGTGLSESRAPKGSEQSSKAVTRLRQGPLVLIWLEQRSFNLPYPSPASVACNSPPHPYFPGFSEPCVHERP